MGQQELTLNVNFIKISAFLTYGRCNRQKMTGLHMDCSFYMKAPSFFRQKNQAKLKNEFLTVFSFSAILALMRRFKHPLGAPNMLCLEKYCDTFPLLVLSEFLNHNFPASSY